MAENPVNMPIEIYSSRGDEILPVPAAERKAASWNDDVRAFLRDFVTEELSNLVRRSVAPAEQERQQQRRAVVIQADRTGNRPIAKHNVASDRQDVLTHCPR